MEQIEKELALKMALKMLSLLVVLGDWKQTVTLCKYCACPLDI